MRDGQADTGGDDLLARLRDVAASCGPDGRLPAERLLTQTLGVGRGRLRGALAQLEAEGHVFRRQGQGTFVVPSPAPSRRALQRLATTISPADVMEVRRQIEPALAALAARRACDADIAGLRTLAARCRAAPDSTAYETADEIFHHRIAELSRNILFLRVYEEIRAVRSMTRWHTERASDLTRAQILARASEHDAIVDAMAAARAADAAQAMDAHLERVEKAMTGRRA